MYTSGLLTNKKRYISYSKRAVATKLYKALQASKLTCLSNNGVTWRYVKNKKRFISSFARPIATKLDRVIVLEKGAPPLLVTLHNSHMTNKKGYISTVFLQGSCLPNWTRWWRMIFCHHAQSIIILWSHDHMLFNDN